MVYHHGVGVQITPAEASARDLTVLPPLALPRPRRRRLRGSDAGTASLALKRTSFPHSILAFRQSVLSLSRRECDNFVAMKSSRIGFVGVGRMGANMARRLHEVGHPVVAIYDAKPVTAAQLAQELGAKAVERVSEVSRLST